MNLRLTDRRAWRAAGFAPEVAAEMVDMPPERRLLGVARQPFRDRVRSHRLRYDLRFPRLHRVLEARQQRGQAGGHRAERGGELQHRARLVGVEGADSLKVRSRLHHRDHREDELERDRARSAQASGRGGCGASRRGMRSASASISQRVSAASRSAAVTAGDAGVSASAGALISGGGSNRSWVSMKSFIA